MAEIKKMKGRNKMKSIMLLAIIPILIILIIPTSISKSKSNDFNPSVDSWYQVEPWEIEYCRKWGGSEEGGLNPGSSSAMPIALSQMTVTAQGERLEYNIGNQSPLFKASWYIEPAEGNIEYAVALVGDGNLEIGSGTASNTNAGFGYYANYINKRFTHVMISYQG